MRKIGRFFLQVIGANPRGQDSSNRVQLFSYTSPSKDDIRKQIVRLSKSENLRTSIQVIGSDYREKLHFHDNIDGFWMVLSGSVAFYDEDNAVLGEFEPLEGIYMPRKTRYRYESTSEEPAEILQVLAFQPGKGWGRTDVEQD
jgi:mannose-6-phosphate isomerase-like protein (cupin superfamily)